MSQKRLNYYRAHFPIEVGIVQDHLDEAHQWCLATVGKQMRYNEPHRWLARPEIEDGEWAAVHKYGCKHDCFFFFKDDILALEFKLKFG